MLMSKEPQIIASLDIETGQGAFRAHYSKDGLAELDFPSGRARPAAGQRGEKAPTLQVERWHEIAVAALLDTLDGKSPRQLPPLDWVGGTDFQNYPRSVNKPATP